VPTRQLLTRVPRKLAAVAGFDLVRRDEGSLRRLAAAGIEPRSVLDVGAALGDWSRACAAVFPAAQYLLVEPLAEFRPSLDAAAASIGSAVVVEAAVAAAAGARTINVHPDLVGSSLLREREGEHVDGVPRSVTVMTVDDLVGVHGLEPPFLLKVDVQGAERDVIAGASTTLPAAAAVICEVSFFGFYFEGTPFEELIATMRDGGFVVYDIANLARRPLDGALSQADVLFVPEGSPARREHVYAAPHQRAAQTAEFAAAIRRRIDRAG
jgi:FkbM family methyltransferase